MFISSVVCFLFVFLVGVCVYMIIQVCVYRETPSALFPMGVKSLEFHTFVSLGAPKICHVTLTVKICLYLTSGLFSCT